jgi:hypothetical protein
MLLPTFHFPLSTLPPQAGALPKLPEGPSFENVRGPIDIPTYEPWQIGIIIVLGLITLALLFWATVAILRARKHRDAGINPATAALAELEAAAKLTLDDDERFAVLSSLALRRYFENSFGIHSTAQTSEEFLNNLRKSSTFDVTSRESLSQFLDQCDGIKFARQSVNTDQRTALTTAAKQLIQKTELTKEATQP